MSLLFCSYRFPNFVFTRYHTPTRRFATKISEEVESPKIKPKSTTALRRTASASLPIRANPTPTRSSIETVFTLATAQKYLLYRLKDHWRSSDSLIGARVFHEAFWVPNWKQGEIFVFGNGSFVCWGLGEKDARRFEREILRPVPGFQLAPLKEAETEELEFVSDRTEETRLQGDLIILGKPAPFDSQGSLFSELPPMAFPQETLLARYAFSQALSRSTALSGLEVSLDDYLSSMTHLPQALEETGKPGMSRKALIKKLGELMKFRQGLNLNRENFSDTPDFYWTEPELERYFKSMSDALEIKLRTDSVNDKITYAAEAQSVLRQLLTESSSHNLELIIIALIAVEVVVALIRDGPELWEMLKGDSADKGTKEV
ncbi:hypothetical protein J3R30DRAFT_3483100 [Lentinula aciculospora]|uniref:DUF155 domain-containing protein n=1 Tax=Lentinula aciculospora TaxID=153920 RepID=A0A9W9A8U9_9AGAR|nr:hypothetical protein J3R30DRAFT_3483100 [Lentinula aciculospora]